MKFRNLFMFACMGFGSAVANPSMGLAQVQVLSSAPPNVEYQYQLYYPRVWGWPGPGWSVGGSLPSQGREGISSFYGRPLPAPLGAGVYVNPFAYSAQLPGPGLAFGLASSSSPSSSSPSSSTPSLAQPGQHAPPISQVAGIPSMGSPVNMMTAYAGQNDGSGNGATSMGTTLPSAGARPEPLRQPIPISSDAAIQRSLEMEAIGNEHFYRKNWLQAYINYRNAVMTARDRSDGHLRLAFAAIALKRFPEAVVEFKHALAIDPMIGKRGESMITFFGPGYPETHKELIRDVAEWSKENLQDQDRLFLLGIILRLNDDSRSQEILEAALRIPGPNEHLVALLKPSPTPDSLAQTSSTTVTSKFDSAELPRLHHRPLALQQTTP